jgi:hypothetical protein
MPTKASRKTTRPARAKKKATGRAATKTVAVKTPGQIVVVNMIPRSLSGEIDQDSEPTIAVNPANPQQIAASAFTADPGGGSFAPIFTSVDGGTTWMLKSIVPSRASDGTAITGDITVSFATKSNRLYAGIIRLPTVARHPRLNILRTNDFQSGAPMKVLVDRTGSGIDQPYVQATTISTGSGAGKDRLYVGDNDFNATPASATIEQSLDAGKTTASFTSVRIESRTTAGQDGPPIRPAIHPDGTVYAVFHSWRTFANSGEGTADVVVVRDDAGGSGAKKFQALVDAGDGKPGIRVVQNVKFNFEGFLGLQRTGGDVSIAVDPTNSSIVYIAYNDDVGPDYMLHVLRSADRGATWSGDIKTVRNALNPALAVNAAGKIGLLYQQLTGSGTSQRWVTQFESSANGGAAWTAVTLATTPANKPDKQFDPYLGDYDHVMSVGNDFFGVFCANNTPDKANFPQGVTYQRNANFTTHTLLDVDNATSVDPSIDPFFFKVTG